MHSHCLQALGSSILALRAPLFWPTSRTLLPLSPPRGFVGPVPTSLSASVAGLCRSQGPRLQFLHDGPGELVPPRSQRELLA